MHSDRYDKQLMREVFERCGYTVSPVPEADGKRADLYCCGSGNDLFVEIKAFLPDEVLMTSIPTGGVREYSMPFDKKSAIEDKVSHAARQLRDTPSRSTTTMRVAAFIIRHPFDACVVRHQILGVLYGKRSIVTASRTRSRAPLYECMYFAESIFFRFRASLDGAALIESDGASLWVNDHSDRANLLLGSQLGQFFESHRACQTADRLEELGYLVADCEIDRRRENEVLAFVARKYDLDSPVLVSFSRYSACASVPLTRA